MQYTCVKCFTNFWKLKRLDCVSSFQTFPPTSKNHLPPLYRNILLFISTVILIILATTLSSRGRALTSSRNRSNHSYFYNIAQFECHCSSMLMRELKYYVRPKKILKFQRMRMFLNKEHYFLNILVQIPYFQLA